VYNPTDGNYYFENIRTWALAFSKYWNIAFTTILNLFFVAAYNFFGNSVTTYIDGITRSISNGARIVLVWIIGIIISVSTGNEWESLDYRVILTELAGFVFLVLALFIYR